MLLPFGISATAAAKLSKTLDRRAMPLPLCIVGASLDRSGRREKPYTAIPAHQPDDQAHWKL